ncbi:MAG: phospholipid carrier-dependent glycosyltransferase [Lentisphaeria bacterium]|nr:phospholipid carrier-dependent glycosyltransferase [Lentisphaeria bacterium]
MKKLWQYLFIPAIILAVYILPLGSRPLITPDETRYAEVPREMIASGNYISPRLNGVRYFEKTPFSYWAFAVSFKLFGMNRFALRLPCMLAMLATAWIVYMLTGHYYEDRRMRLLAAMVFATLPFVYLLGGTAITDMFLTLFVTAATVTAFLAAQDDVSTGKKIVLLVLCGVSSGLAFLTKGFLAFAVPVVTLVPYLIWDRKWKKLFTLPWIPLVALLVTAAPWCIAIHLQEPDFWNYFFFVEHVNRFFGKAKAQHPKSFFYFIPVMALTIAVWLPMLPNLCKVWYRKAAGSPLLKFCICWAGVPFLFFSCSSGKLATYILPCIPPMSVLIAVGLQQVFVEERRTLAFNWILGCLTAALGLTVLGSIGNLLTGIPEVFFMKEDWRQMVLLGAAIVMTLIGLWLTLKAADRYGKLFLLMASLFPMLIVTNFIFPVAMREWKAPSGFLAEVYPDLPKENVIFINHRRIFQDVCLEFRRTDVKMLMGRNEIAYGLSYPEEKDRFIPDFDALEALYWKQKEKKGHLVIVTPDKTLKYFEKVLPKPVWIRRTHPGLDGYAVILY